MGWCGSIPLQNLPENKMESCWEAVHFRQISAGFPSWKESRIPIRFSPAHTSAREFCPAGILRSGPPRFSIFARGVSFRSLPLTAAVTPTHTGRELLGSLSVDLSGSSEFATCSYAIARAVSRNAGNVAGGFHRIDHTHDLSTLCKTPVKRSRMSSRASRVTAGGRNR